MFLIGLVQLDSKVKGYAAKGKDEFNRYLQKKTIGKTMKSVPQVMPSPLESGTEATPVQLSQPLVKAVTIMAFQPLVGGTRADDGVGCTLIVRHFTLVEVLLEFSRVYGLVWFQLYVRRDPHRAPFRQGAAELQTRPSSIMGDQLD